MIATTIHTIRVVVIGLLQKSGHTLIEATQKWDSIYSKQYRDAKPNVTHAWVIGRYTFEFIKKGGD
jgi:hypothetical protein